ncbi:MAG: hypothetical protein YK1309IOTA_1310002 [Marine Group I thaumarchaeote]|nr:MAG: hypothetical protein YK1309IOTA_1310002 [Marine Group I thaumarchaeote]
MESLESRTESKKSELWDYEAQIKSTKKELVKLTGQIEFHQGTLKSLITQQEAKRKEIELAKKELKFIESDLSTVRNKEDSKKVVQAASAMIAEMNAKIQPLQKELQTVYEALDRERNENQKLKKRLDEYKE